MPNSTHAAPLRRRTLLQGAAVASSAIAFPLILTGCGSGGDALDAGLPTSSRQYVLAWGEFGELHKGWIGDSRLTLSRPDGTQAIYGTTHTELNVPSAVAVAPDGTFWVADTGNCRLVHLDAELRPLGTLKTVSGQRFSHPTGVALAPDGRLVVSDALRGKIAVVNASTGDGFWAGINADEHIGTGWRPNWSTETDPRILEAPRFVQVTRSGTIVTLDTVAARMVLFSAAGEATESIRLGGRPFGFAMAPDDTCYVCDTSRKSVSRVDLQTGQVTVAMSAQESGRLGGMPYGAVWRTAADSEVSNLMIALS